MQVVVLCGGKGTRLSEYTERLPKPLIEVGKKPILWHILEMYKSFGFNDFILCLGYKGSQIRKYFSNHKSDKSTKIRFVDTGEDANKAQRILKVEKYIKSGSFFVTYGDDLSDVNLKKLLESHKKSKKIVTLTAINLVSPFGILEFDKSGKNVIGFREKPRLEYYMNGGFYIFDREIFRHLEKSKDLESHTFEKLAKMGKIGAYRHDGFWKSMNTLKDVIELNEFYESGKWPWKK